MRKNALALALALTASACSGSTTPTRDRADDSAGYVEQDSGVPDQVVATPDQSASAGDISPPDMPPSDIVDAGAPDVPDDPDDDEPPTDQDPDPDPVDPTELRDQICDDYNACVGADANDYGECLMTIEQCQIFLCTGEHVKQSSRCAAKYPCYAAQPAGVQECSGRCYDADCVLNPKEGACSIECTNELAACLESCN